MMRVSPYLISDLLGIAARGNDLTYPTWEVIRGIRLGFACSVR